MRATVLPTFSTFASLLIAVAVGMSGTHAKDIITVTTPMLWHEAKQKADDSGHHSVKAVSDLHNHVDKAKVQHGGDAGQQADTRSLRLLQHKKAAMIHNRLSDRMRLWWTMTSLRLSA